MHSPNPSWRVKKRPCPFYLDGRCLFADSCNFIHDAGVQVPHAPFIYPQKHTSDPSIQSSPTTTPFRVDIQPHRSFTSHRQSKRLSQLLIALQDVIGADENDISENDVAPSRSTNDSDSVPDHSSLEKETVEHTVDNGTPVAESEVNGEDTNRSNPGDHSPDPPSDDLSPMSNLPFVPFLHDTDEIIDSGYADNWTSPYPLSISPPRSPSVSSMYALVLPSPPRNPPHHPEFLPAPTPPVLDNNTGDGSTEVDPESWSDLEGEITASYLNMTPTPPGLATGHSSLTSEYDDDDSSVVNTSLIVHPNELGSSDDFEPLELDHTTPNDELCSSLPVEESSRRDPSVLVEKSDSLQSLYDVYSELVSPHAGDIDLPLTYSPLSVHTPDTDPAVEDGTHPFGMLQSRTFSPFSHDHVFTFMSSKARRASVRSPSPLSFRSRESFSGQSRVGGDSEKQGVEVSTKGPHELRNSVVSLGGNNRVTSSNITSSAYISSSSQPSSNVEKPPDGSHHNSPNGSDRTSRLKPLRLSIAFGLSSPVSPSPLSSKSYSKNHTEFTNRTSIASTIVSSELSLSNNHLLSPAFIPRPTRSSHIPTILPLTSRPYIPQTAPLSETVSWRASHRTRNGLTQLHLAEGRLSRQSEPTAIYEDIENECNENHRYDRTARTMVPRTAPLVRPATAVPTVHAIATPRPSLLFAIASDDVAQVRRVLESGEARPSDQVGPQSALAFTLTNDKLTHKIDIVKTLLAYGADPATLKNPEENPPQFLPSEDRSDQDGDLSSTSQFDKLLEGLDPATRYYVGRADAAHTRRTSALIHRSFFRPLTRVRYELVGQDCVLEQLFRVLSAHSQQLSVTPIVVLLCGPSGHGKSLLARKFGSLLDVPTHTVNMTTLQSTLEVWQSPSISPYEEPTSSTLAEFLIQNEGRRCVVVLDEIEKTEDEKVLWSLLMPWELGRCSLGASKRYIDVRNVIWLGTSNVGHELVFEYHASRPDSHFLSRDEYVELMHLLRPCLSERLGPSLTSRITTVLPFVPFSLEERIAISAEALHSLGGESVKGMPPGTVQWIIDRALSEYIPAEGARSLYRAVSSQLAGDSD